MQDDADKVMYVFRKGVGWCPERMYLHNGKWLTESEAIAWLEEVMAKGVFEALQPYTNHPITQMLGPTIVRYPRAIMYMDDI